MKRKLVLFFITYLVWCLLNWVPDWQHLVIGIFAATLISVATGDLFIHRPHIAFHIDRYFYFIFCYFPLFLWELIKANAISAVSIIKPSPHTNSGIIKIKTSLKSDTALTFLANSISMSYGLLTVDIDKDNSLLYVYCLNLNTEDREATVRPVFSRFENILSKVFD